MRTGLGGEQSEKQRAESDEWLQANYHQLPVGLLEPEDVVGAVVFLASPSARYIHYRCCFGCCGWCECQIYRLEDY